VSDLFLIPQTARVQADEQARVAADVLSLLCSGHQLLNESGLPRLFPRVAWTVTARGKGRDPAWVVVEDSGDPTYLILVHRERPLHGPGGFTQYRHSIRVALPSRMPWRRWRVVGPVITRPEHLSANLAVIEARTRR
jgi:hypothetical protein